MAREGLGKLDAVDKVARACDPSIGKAEGEHKIRATWVNTNKMKQRPAPKRTGCVQGATGSTTFVDEREQESRQIPQAVAGAEALAQPALGATEGLSV